MCSPNAFSLKGPVIDTVPLPHDVLPWMTEEIMSARREKRKGERIWRKSRLKVHLQVFIALCLILKNLIHDEKE